ncbi:MAG: hypothetical protein HFJ17_05695, partial [Clostridia bacterium]|nr:hypothetical protein [Clostridia bacterium]
MLKNNRGITLVSLVITILVLAITGSIATYSGISALRYINFTNAKTQMETMQSKVNGWYQEVKNNPETEISSYGKPLNEADAEKVSTTLGPISKDGYKYFSSDYIKNTLKIDGISYDFLININTASVFLYGGITYEGTKYCSAKDFGINQVETEGISGKIGFDTTIKDSNIIVHNIKIQDNNHKDLDINKYDVQYKLGDNNYWTTAKSDLKKKYNNDDNAWYIPIKGTCNIKITANEIESEEQYITLENIKSANTTFKENATLIDDNGDKIVVPKNFKIASESPIKVTEGMIIEDNDKNQYVWIPVFERTDDRTWGANYNAVKTKTEYTAEYYTAIQTALK